MKDIIIIGASGHGKVVADIARLNGYTDISFLDDDKTLKTCMGYPVIGKLSDAEKHRDSDFFVAIGNPTTRERIQNALIDNNFKITTLIHPSAVIAENVTIGKGTVIMAGTIINPNSKIGNGCIINTGATVDHDNVVKDYAHISVGSHLAGTVTIGERTWIGAGATVSNNIIICPDCTIGAGAVVVRNIHDKGTYIGVPARIWI